MGATLNVSFLLLIICFRLSESADSCGKSLEKHLQTRIIGGTDVGYYKYPWYGVLKINGSLQCGCSMIGDQVAITAANCFRDYLPVKADQNLAGVFSVTLGVYDRCNDKDLTIKTFEVTKIIIHDGFVKGKPHVNNVALLKLATPTGFEPVCLPPKPITSDARPSEGIITGLGMIHYQPVEATCTLHEGRVLIYHDEQCADALKNVGEDPGVLDKTFCAGNAGKSKTYGCGIDLGGPLVATDSNGSWYILGIISFKKCPDNDNITLYQDVSKYLDWIHEFFNSTTPSPPAPSKTPDDYDEPDYDENPTKTTIQDGASVATSTYSSIIVGPKERKHGGHKHGKEKRHHHFKNHHRESKRHERNHHEKKHHENKHHENKHHENNHHEKP